jgi:hypothetical protein
MVARTVPVRVGEVDLEFEVVAVGGTEATSRVSKAAGDVLDAFGEARQAIVEIAVSVAEVIERMSARSARPDQIEVAFGLKVSAEGSVIVAGVAGEASLQVKLVYDAGKKPVKK